MALTVTSREPRAGIFHVFPSGALDSNTFPILERKLGMLGESSPRAVVLDLRDLSYMSSAGIRVILAAKKSLRQKGGELFLTNLQPQIRKVIDIIKAAPSLGIFGSLEELDRYLDEMQQQVLKKGE